MDYIENAKQGKKVANLPYRQEVAKEIFDNIFALDPNYCDWESATYKAPEQHEGFAMFLCLRVADKVIRLLDKEFKASLTE